MPVAIPNTYINGLDYAPAQTHSGDPTDAGNASRQNVIDGTPARVAAIMVLTVAVMVGFRYSGIKFNVAAGN